MHFLQHFVEYQGWGMNALTISALGTFFFTFLQGGGTVDQTKKIWSEKSAKAVSLQLFSYNTAYFFAFFFYGIEKNSLAMIFNSLLGVIFIPIVIGILRFEKHSVGQKILAGSYFLLIPLMILLPQKDLVILIGLFGIGAFLSLQIGDVISAKSFGALSIKFMVIFLSTNCFWFVYAIGIHNIAFIAFNGLAIVLYSLAICLYFKYRKNS